MPRRRRDRRRSGEASPAPRRRSAPGPAAAAVAGEQEAYLREMLRTRGYVLDYHKVLVAEDLPFMKALNQALAVSYTDARRLDRKTKELISVAVHTAIASGKDHIKAHIDVARREGATKEEVLEVLELLALSCGLPRFMLGLHAWMEAFPVRRIEVDTTEGGPRP